MTFFSFLLKMPISSSCPRSIAYSIAFMPHLSTASLSTLWWRRTFDDFLKPFSDVMWRAVLPSSVRRWGGGLGEENFWLKKFSKKFQKKTFSKFLSPHPQTIHFRPSINQQFNHPTMIITSRIMQRCSTVIIN